MKTLLLCIQVALSFAPASEIPTINHRDSAVVPAHQPKALSSLGGMTRSPASSFQSFSKAKLWCCKFGLASLWGHVSLEALPAAGKLQQTSEDQSLMKSNYSKEPQGSFFIIILTAIVTREVSSDYVMEAVFDVKISSSS